MAKVVKLSNGKSIEIPDIKWKQIKENKLFSTLMKSQVNGDQITLNINDEDLDKIISIVIPNQEERDELDFDDVIKLASEIINEIVSKKK